MELGDNSSFDGPKIELLSEQSVHQGRGCNQEKRGLEQVELNLDSLRIYGSQPGCLVSLSLRRVNYQ